MEKEMIYARDLMERWNMNDLNFVDFVANHVPSYNDDKAFLFPYEKVTMKQVLVSLDLQLPSAQALFLKYLDNVFFYMDDVERFEKIHPELVEEPKGIELTPDTGKQLSEFDKGFLKYANRKIKKNPTLSPSSIAKAALIQREDWLYKGRSKDPKKETLEKRLRKLLKQGK